MKFAPTPRHHALAAVALMASVSLAACGGSSGASGNKLGTIAAGKIKFAFRSDDKPVEFVQDGKPAGFLIELTQAMAKKMGLTPQYVATNFNSMLPNVHNHMYDAAAFGTLVTPARQQVTAFTTPVSFSQAQLISRKKAPIQTVQGAAGKTVAITQGSELIPILQKLAPKVVIKQFPNIASSANALTAGQVDGLFTGISTTQGLLDQHHDFTATQAITSGESSFPVAKDRPKLMKALNDALAATVTDGTYTQLFNKWNPPGVMIPQDMLNAYPGMKQRPAAAPSSGS